MKIPRDVVNRGHGESQGNQQEPLIRVAEAVQSDISHLASLHMVVLHDESITRFGRRFLRAYYDAFHQSPHALVLIARDSAGDVVGGLVGALQPSEHYRYFVRSHGLRLAALTLMACIIHPYSLRVLLRTRLKRYIRGVWRHLRGTTVPAVPLPAESVPSPDVPTTPPAIHPSRQVAEIAHLFVKSDTQSRGVGSALVQAYEVMAQRAGVHRIDLVTFPLHRGGAGTFYEKLGWTCHGEKVSRSGECYLMYRKIIDHGGG